jgi:hypothetical protein
MVEAGRLHLPALPVGTPLVSPSFIKGDVAGHTVSHDRFSVGEVPGRNRVREVPVEIVPILSTIFVLNRYFLKRADFNRKKPADLAGFL